MIGDWLMHSNGRPMRVTRIDGANFACGTPHCWDYNNSYAFIELTSELLEKNGFVKTESLSYEESRVGISLLYKEGSNEEHGYRVLIENMRPGNETGTVIKSAKYVHEIQHALKGLGIEIDFAL